MDGRSSLNILYFETLEAMGIDQSRIRPSVAPFHGIVLGKQMVLIGQIDLAVMFGDADNYRIETLTFEVVDFSGPYHIILGRPCYVKFIPVPSYAYLKLKMPRPVGIITVEAKVPQALACEQSSIEMAAAAVAVSELKEQCREAAPAPTKPDAPSTSSTFKSTEDTKAIRLDEADPAKTVRIGAGLSPA